MRKKYLFACVLLFIFACNKQKQKGELTLPANSQQVLLVIAENDTTIRGEAQLFQWENKQYRWLAQSEKTAITLGRTGLAWGRGVHDAKWVKGQTKKEGDGKAPMGFFPITELFGYAEKSTLPFQTKMPYIQATKSLICVDDVNSRHYNQIFDAADDRKREIDWKSKEDMLRKDKLYELGAVIDYNVSNTTKGEGSCVFLHIWRSPSSPTAGCTAGDLQAMQTIFSKLNPEKKPLLVQLTRAEYEEIKELVRLPE
ncbi:MAG: L,D-transpeptidase [Bacteroidia bacterium]